VSWSRAEVTCGATSVEWREGWDRQVGRRETRGGPEAPALNPRLGQTQQDPGPGDWRFWGKFEKLEVPMELHVPCRDPIDHLLSQVPL
jgi:hypothetical protein